MWDSSGEVAIAFNGEIYGYKALREELEADGFQFESETDTEVLVNLWVQRGREALEHINGMYALAIWDTRNSLLTLARDPAGIKPLYFSQTPKGVVFASEMKSLLQTSEVSREVDNVALLQTLTYLWSPGPRTVLANVKKLPPGGWMEIRKGAIIATGNTSAPALERLGVVEAHPDSKAADRNGAMMTLVSKSTRLVAPAMADSTAIGSGQLAEESRAQPPNG